MNYFDHGGTLGRELGYHRYARFHQEWSQLLASLVLVGPVRPSQIPMGAESRPLTEAGKAAMQVTQTSDCSVQTYPDDLQDHVT